MRRKTIFLVMVILLIWGSASSALAFDKVVYANADPLKYRIELDLNNKITTIYQRDKNGKYTDIAKQFICTTGTDETPTPTGSFRLNDSRRRFGYFSKFDVYAQYWTNVSGGIYFHSILYTEPKEGKFTRLSFNNLGSQASHGCIRLLVEDARWIYYNCPAGTYGVIRNDIPANKTLRNSLMPKVSASNYKPEPDAYENTKRSLPMAVLKKDAVFTDTSKRTWTVLKDTPVSIVSSGSINCRVYVAGVEGHIDTKNLDFIANGPKDQDALKKMNLSAVGTYRVKTAKTDLLKTASSNANVVASYGKGTFVSRLGSTASYYNVKVDGKTGYVLKTDVEYVFAPKGEASKVVSIEKESVEEDSEVILDLDNDLDDDEDDAE